MTIDSNFSFNMKRRNAFCGKQQQSQLHRKQYEELSLSQIKSLDKLEQDINRSQKLRQKYKKQQQDPECSEHDIYNPVFSSDKDKYEEFNDNELQSNYMDASMMPDILNKDLDKTNLEYKAEDSVVYVSS